MSIPILKDCPLGYALHEIIPDEQGVPIDYRFLEGNQELLNTMGKDKDSIIGKRVTELYPDIQEMAPQWMESIRELMRSGEPQIREEYSYPKNKYFKVHLWKNSETTFSSLFLDTTHEKKLEEEEKEYKRNEFLQSQKLQSLGQLSGRVAHDFGNLITILTEITNSFESELQDTPSLLIYTQKYRDILKTSDSLVKQLLNYYKPHPYTIEVIPAISLCERALDILKFSGRKNLKFEIEEEDTGLLLSCDSNLIVSAMVNLGLNGIEAMPDGGILKIRLFKEVIDSLASVVLSVEDSGVGIREEDSNDIYTPYYTTKTNGSGLGLSSVMGILEKHHGKLNVESKLGEGSRFQIVLPEFRIENS